MKLKYLIPSLLALLTLAACSDYDDVTLLDEVQVSSSYIAIDANGGSTTITVNAKYDWSIESDDVPDWLTISPMSGAAGTSSVTFSAGETLDSHSATLYLDCGGKQQILTVIQGESSVEEATIAEIFAGPDSKTYRVTGTVTAIASTSYGNFYMNDGTTDTDLYIYGTVNSSGSYDWDSFNIDVGDIVTVEGPKSTYNTTVELVDATFISVEKSLISVDSIANDGALPLEGGEIAVYISCKGDGVTVSIPEDAESWLSISSIVSTSDGAVVTFKAASNPGGDRSTTITFYTTSGSDEYSSQATIEQEGSIVPVSVAEFNAAEVGNVLYRITGYISSIANEKYGNLYVKDYSAETYVYGIDDYSNLGLKEGDIVTLVGKRGQYGSTIEMTDAYLESSIPVTGISVADFRNLPDDSNAYYRLTGTVTQSTEDNTKFDLDTYGNFAITDETGSVYVYGMLTGVGGESKQFGTLGVKEGDTITIICYKTTYNGLVEASGGMYVSHTSN